MDFHGIFVFIFSINSYSLRRGVNCFFAAEGSKRYCAQFQFRCMVLINTNTKIIDNNKLLLLLY